MTYFSVNASNLSRYQQEYQMREKVNICVCLRCSLEYALLIYLFHVASKYTASFPKNSLIKSNKLSFHCHVIDNGVFLQYLFTSVEPQAIL